jgi:broad specificity phosphatase PhoE
LKQIFFVRHGQTEWNAVARMQGQQDSALSELGREQSEVNGRLLARLGIESLYSSTLERARCSAEIINRFLRLPIVYDDRLKEWDCVDWSGHLYSEVARRWPAEWAAFEADRFHYRGPNCENYPDMSERCSPFLEALLAEAVTNVAVVSHGVVGRVMIAMLLGLDESTTLAFRQPNDVVYRVRLSAGAASGDHYVGGSGPYEGLVLRS